MMILTQIQVYKATTLWYCSKLTIEKLIDEHKVVLYSLLCNLPKVRLQDLHHLVQKLEDQGCIYVLSGSCHDPDIGPPGMEVASPGNVGDWRADSMARMDHTHTECINCGTAAEEGGGTKITSHFQFNI